MRTAANFAWGNRQLLMWQAREVFERVFGRTWEDLGMQLVYDVAHNIAKFEGHEITGATKQRVGAPQGGHAQLSPGHPEVPAAYQDLGQPVLIPGGHGAGASWVLVGQPGSMEQTSARPVPRHGAAVEPDRGSHEACGTVERSSTSCVAAA